MNYRKIVNMVLLCVGICLIIANRLADMPALGWVGDISLISGVIMLPKTASIDRRKPKKEADDVS